MSNGPDLSGAVGACHAARRDIVEMHEAEDFAKAHFEQAHKEAQNADKAKTPDDKFDHHLKSTEEKNKGDSESADQHRQDAWKHQAEYYAKMGRDPTKGIPASGKDGPDCKPARDAMVKEIGKQVPDAVKQLTDGLGRKAGP